MAAFISETCVNILFSLYSIPAAQPDSDFIDILLPIHKDIWKTQLNSDKNEIGKELKCVTKFSSDFFGKSISNIFHYKTPTPIKHKCLS